MKYTPKTKPIYGTDFTKGLPQAIEMLRMEICQARGKIHDIEREFPLWKDRVHAAEGALTCAIAFLYNAVEEIKKTEIKWEDAASGKSISFSSRGIGLDDCPCFICWATGLNNNIAAFVESKEEGELAAEWFQGGARLDFRPHEPKWIQVKIGGCEKHLKNLENLNELIHLNHSRLRPKMIEEAKNLVDIPAANL